MAQKVRLSREIARAGFIRNCTSCRKPIEPPAEYFHDIASDDDLCAQCSAWFIDNKYAVIVN